MSKRKIAHKIKKAFFITCYFMFACMIILNFARSGLNADGKPQSMFGYYLFTVESGSMGEDFPVGSLIVVKHQKEYNIGDVVTYKEGNQLITHRIIKIENGFITAQGDENNTPDESTSWMNVLGKVIHVSVFGGKVIDAARSPLSVIIIVFAFGFLFIIDKFSDIYNKKQEEKQLKKDDA